MAVALRHWRHFEPTERRAASGQVKIMWRRVRKGGGGDSEREGTVEINSLKKRAKKHCYHGMLWKRDLEARQYDFLLSSKSTQGE